MIFVNIKTLFGMIGQLFAILNKKQKTRCFGLFFIFIITASLETLGVSIVIPFILALVNPSSLREYKIVNDVCEKFHIDTDFQLVFVTAVLIIGCYILKNGIILFANYVQANVRNRIEKELSIKMLVSYLKRPYTYFLNINSAEIIRGVHEDTISVAEIIDALSGLMAEALTCILIGTFLIILNPIMAVGILIVAFGTALITILSFKKTMALCGEKSRENYLKKYSYLYQSITGIKETIVMQRRSNFLKQFDEVAENAKKYNTIYKTIMKVPNRVIETIFIGSLLLLVCISMNQTNDVGKLITELGAMAVAAVRVLPSVSSIAGYINALIYHRPALESAFQNIMEDNTEQEQTADYEFCKDEEDDIVFQDKLEINHIFWKYDGAVRNVLEDISFCIKKGAAVALIGESGAGKTTLADMILGLLKPQQGDILIDGKSIYDIPKNWSNIISYVPQTVFIVDDTIKRNVAFGIREEDIDEAKVWNALEKAQMKEHVKLLPDTIQTMMGERGVKMSGGQRQRIAIARALYNDPDILVLDEATSALDTETESAVMESIEALRGEKTLIIIAHRLTTIQKCDFVYEVSKGKIKNKYKEETV